FFSIGNSPAPELPDMLGLERTDEGSVAVDSNGETSVKGVYAAGDMTPGPHLLQVAAAKGTIAAGSCADSLIKGLEEDG
ncbi:MAG TPA: FAD-dependent oxidoreductase, partial [Actinomycetota bacterium]|nr:FAD-dependent oxidoreductase [Actinomycetota bacterium]